MIHLFAKKRPDPSPDSTSAPPSCGETARAALRGNWSAAVVISGALALLDLIGSALPGLFSRNTSFAAAVMSFLVSLILLLLLSLPFDGAAYSFLRALRGEKPDLRCLIYPFYAQPDRFLIAAAAETACSVVSMSPIIAAYLFPSAVRLPLRSAVILLAAGLALLVFLRLNLSQTVWLLLEDDSLGAVDAIKKSISLMKGKKRKLLRILLPFIGYAVLSVCSFGIALLWVVPYYLSVNASFYMTEIKETEDSL